jgi:large subunit ribosomal protein L29
MADKKNKLIEIRDRSEQELRQTLDRARDELFRLRLGRNTNQLTNVHEIRAKRREIARIMTVISQRSKGLEAQGATKKAE